MNKSTLFAVLALFLAPVVIAVLLNSQWLDWRPGSTRNHGELLEPAVRLPDSSWETLSGETVSRDALEGQWQLLHYRSSGCDEACLEDLYWLRQIRLAQDRHQPEIALMFVTPGEVDSRAVEQIRELADDYRIFSEQAGHSLATALPDSGLEAISYIVDPGGHIILRYPQDADFNGMRRDLSRLLTWTKTGPE
ncbi:SCO family protein [Wenzhouxiangella sp. EGI_FJ10409]|uniref:SCO family protein n=1 Tax=Wenzhouxiangella sp. EGI_FJ10409 TaxID=3243767 RepID=UPI0035E2ED60